MATGLLLNQRPQFKPGSKKKRLLGRGGRTSPTGALIHFTPNPLYGTISHTLLPTNSAY